EMLTPVYERLHDMKGLILCAEWQLSVTEDAGERLALFQQIAKLLEQQNEAGKGAQAAFHKLLQALTIPDIESGGGQLDQELKARALALQAEDVLSEALVAAASIDSLQHDTARRIELLTHAAQLQQHLGQHELAKESLEQALELDADN